MREEALTTPAVLEWARLAAGLEREDAARKIGVKANRIGEWETGERQPTIRQLKKIAHVYKRPLGVFYLAVPPSDDPLPTDYRRIDPDHDEPLSPTLRLAIRTAHGHRRAALELFEELGEEPPRFAFRLQLGGDPEEAGTRVRARLGVAGGPIGDTRTAFNTWRQAAEHAGILVLQAPGIPVDEMRGFSLSDSPLPVVVLNIKDAYAGRSFSLLHEIAHVALRRDGVCLLEAERSRTELGRVESYCNHVAGAALLPAATLLDEAEVANRRGEEIPDEDLEAVARRHGVSGEVVLRRLLVLKRVSRSYYRTKRREFVRRYAELSERRARRPSPVPRPRLAIARAGRLFTRLVLDAYDEDRITSSDVSELLGERIKHLERIRAELEGRSHQP